MKQIGGPLSLLYALDRRESDEISAAIADGRIKEPREYRTEGPGGALIHFSDPTDVTVARLIV